jgi:putative chitinase
MREIGENILRKIMPQAAELASWVPALGEAMDRFAINNEFRVAAFLAQVAHESGQMKRLSENLNYSAKGLCSAWPNRFPSMTFAAQYERKPEKIANYVYANRLGNGPEKTGHGWRYRGRGLIQLTGLSNYRTTGGAIGFSLEKDPDLLLQPRVAALSAAHFWQSRGCNALADDRNDDDNIEDFEQITHIINGGTTGLKDRVEFWTLAWKALGIH